MYPTDIENYNYTPSEKCMYETLKEQLPEKYHVFYSVRWFENREGKRVDSESDFIIFDPSFGYITVEVKGGKDIIQDGSTWYLVEMDKGEESKRRLKCSPYEQAEKSMRHFYNYFHEEFHQSFHGTYGFAVAIPWFSSEKIVSDSNPREVTIDMTDIPKLRQKINNIFHYWKNKRNLSIPFSAEQRQRFISLINKRISLSAAAGALIPIKEKELSKINTIQDSILDALYNYRELKFVGGAGTGKTFIGAKKALREAKSGKKVLFTCCSATLSNYVESELLHNNTEITCQNFEALMRGLFKSKYDSIADSGLGFFDSTENIPEEQKYDCIIVDEAQDYDVDKGMSIRALLKKDFTAFYVFFDENQNIFFTDFNNSFAIGYPPIILRYNIRNTGRIYNNAITKTGLGKETVANTLLGIEPEYTNYKNATQCKKALTNIVNRLTIKENVALKSIVILSNYSYEESIFRNEDFVGSYLINKDKKNELENGIIFSTVKNFKGMEADIVIFINHVGKDLIQECEQLCEEYVALTRPRYYLYVLNVLMP